MKEMKEGPHLQGEGSSEGGLGGGGARKVKLDKL